MHSLLLGTLEALEISVHRFSAFRYFCDTRIYPSALSDLDSISLFVKGHLNFETIGNSFDDNAVQFKHPTGICHKPFVFNQLPKNAFQIHSDFYEKFSEPQIRAPQNSA